MIKRYLRPIVILNLIGILISCKDLELPEPIQQAYENLPEKILQAIVGLPLESITS